MTPEAQRIAIAEACGWKRIRNDPDAALMVSKHPRTYWVGVAPINQVHGWEVRTANHWLIPEYLTDLNAMHEAENTLTRHSEWDSNGERCPSTQEKYEWCLRSICNRSPTFATAAQRAEAFLRTIGKWEDKP